MSTPTETNQEELIAERDSGGILILTFNRPKSLNSLTPGVLDSLRAAVEDAAADDDVRCIVLTGAGRAFGSGASLRDNATFDPEHVLLTHYNPAVLAMQKLEKPLLASINGLAVGASCSLALACDFRIMADDARLALLFTRIGLAPDAGASYILPRLVGVTRATEMMMLGDDVYAEQALEWGIVNRVVPAAELEAETRSFAERLAALPRAAGMVKRLMRKTMTLNLPEQLTLEAKVQGEAGRTEDFSEGVGAFMEKRPARFSGR